MRFTVTCFALVILLPAACRSPAQEDSLAAQGRAALRRAVAFMRSISTEGGYVWSYSEDLTERWGETKATPTQIWIQPPGTPSVGMAFLRAFAATQEVEHLEAARAAAEALARSQLASGGWRYSHDFSAEQADPGLATLDDDTSQSALRFLMAFAEAAPARPEREFSAVSKAIDRGIKGMMEAQYPNGAWPQTWDGKARNPDDFPLLRARLPAETRAYAPGRSYNAFYTLNDHVQSDCIRTMLDAYHRLGRQEYLESAIRGGEFLILAQLPEPQPAWAQQYNFQMEPAWARAFEPPAVSSAESAGALRALVTLYRETEDERFLKPIPAALAWLRRSEIRPGRWARFYELNTNRPIYGDRDGKIHYTLEELSPERRGGYAWEGEFGIPDTIRLAEGAKEPATLRPPRKPAEADVRKVIQSLDDRGRWIESGRIQTRVFIRNVETLCDYLESIRPPASSRQG